VESARALERVPVLAQAQARVRALEPVPVPVLARASGPGSERAPALGTEPWAMERSGRVRRFHKLPWRGPMPPGIPLIAKSLER